MTTEIPGAQYYNICVPASPTSSSAHQDAGTGLFLWKADGPSMEASGSEDQRMGGVREEIKNEEELPEANKLKMIEESMVVMVEGFRRMM